MTYTDNAIFFGTLAMMSLGLFVISGWLPLALSGVACSIVCARFATRGVIVRNIAISAVERELFGAHE